MYSAQTLNAFLSGRIHLPTFLLPLLALTTTFSSRPIYPNVILHHAISLAFIVCAILVFYKSCSNKMLAISIPTALVLIRVLRFLYGDQNEVLVAFYFVPYSIILLGVGAKMVRDYPLLLFRQIGWLCAISVILSLMQILGVQWAQSLDNHYWYHFTGGGAEQLLFVQWSDLPPTNNPQWRPVGFSSSNNVLSQYLLFFYAFSILWFVTKKNYFQPSAVWLFIVSFACALTGAKLVLLGVILISLSAWIICKVKESAYLLRVLFITFTAYCLYWILFPGLFLYNYNLDLFAFNAMIRITSVLNAMSIPFVNDILIFVSQFNTGEYIGENKNVAKAFSHLGGSTISGVDMLIKHVWILAIAAIVLAPIWIFRLCKLCEGEYIDTKKLSAIMLIAMFASTLGGPFITTPYFWFFFSFALFPFGVLLLRDSQQMHSSYHLSGNA